MTHITIPLDLGAIDLDWVRDAAESFKRIGYGIGPKLNELADEIERLREQVAGYNTLFDLSAERERPWLEKWRIANGRPDALPDYGEMLGWLSGQIEAAEARYEWLTRQIDVSGEATDDAEALADVLVKVLGFYAAPANHEAKVLLSGFGRSNVSEDGGLKARTVLTTTPAHVFERARAKDEALNVLRGYYATEFGQQDMIKQVGIYLAKLDAIGKEGP